MNRKQSTNAMEVRDLMRRRRVSQSLLAEKMGVTQPAICNWLAERFSPLSEARKEAMIKAIKEFE